LTSPHESDQILAKDLYLFVELVTTVRVPDPSQTQLNQRNRESKDIKASKKDVPKSKPSDNEKSKFDDAEEENDEEVLGKNKKSESKPKSYDDHILDNNFSKNPLTVEMCSGWVMVPLANVVLGKPIKSRLKMLGGTPFNPVKVKKDEIKKRPGTIEVIIFNKLLH
jgi:hypothetical protein